MFDNGATQLDTAAAQETVLATRQTLVNVEQQVLFAAVQAYVNVLTQQDVVALRQNNLRLLQEELRAANDRFEVGEVTRTDVALAQSQVAEARANLTDARGALLSARATYEEVVGHAPGRVSAYPPLPRRASSLDAAQALALRSHPRLRAQQHAVKAAELKADSALRDMGPSLNLSANASHGEFHDTAIDSDDFSVSLNLSQTLYAGGGLAAARRAELARLDAERGNLLSVQRSITSNAASAYTGFDTAAASLVSSNQRVRAAQVAFEGVREEATLGSRTTLDVLQAEQELLDAQTARLSARATQALAAYDLLQAQGLLTAENLNLAVERYDPEIYHNQVRNAPAFVTKRGQDLDRVLKALRKN
ncbi:TolC family protein [Phaeobacter sp. HF9A]|uniref:TolC family protein n=1 Tax=Phaeobacter sp. HF9A TaxID=2721561 RepID=UPI0034C6B7C5